MPSDPRPPESPEPSDAAAPESAGAAEAALPLDALDLSLRPVRRVVARAVHRPQAPAAPAHFGANTARLLARALELELPDAVSAALDDLRAALEAIDAGDPEALATAWQVLTRVDATLGLPLDPRRHRLRPVRSARRGGAGEGAGGQVPPVEGGGGAPAGEGRAEARGERRGRGRRGRAGLSQKARRGRGGESSAPAAAEVSPEQVADGPALASDGESGGDDSVGFRGRVEVSLDGLDLDEGAVSALAAAGFATAADVLFHPPSEVREVAPVHGAGRPLPAPGEEAAVGGRVAAAWTRFVPGADGRAEASAWVRLHGAGDLTARLAQLPTPAGQARLAAGHKVTLVGRVARGRMEGDPAWLDAAVVAGGDAGVAWIRAYGLGAAEPAFDDAMAGLLAEVDGVDAAWPSARAQQLSAAGLPRLRDALVSVHAGEGVTSPVRKRLVVEELVAFQIGAAWSRFVLPERAPDTEDGGEGGARTRRALSVSPSHTLNHRVLSQLEDAGHLPALSPAAWRALEAVKRDVRATSTGRRVLVGVAASGVADVALAAVALVGAARSQVVVLAAEPLAAAARFDVWEPALREVGIQARLLVAPPARDLQEAVRKGEVGVVFSTPSVLAEAGLDWKRLGLMVRFEQRHHGSHAPVVAALSTGGGRATPHELVVVRTPLPAAALQLAYPAHDLTWLPEGPRPARGTVWADTHREEAYRRLSEAAATGVPALVAFPITRQGVDLLDSREAAQLLATLQAQVFGSVVPPDAVGLLHGAAPIAQRQGVWEDFLRGRVRLLVATCMVEAAEPPPFPVVALVEHADRMDLQRLLQLRALVGSQGHVHYVVGDTPAPVGAARVADLAAGLGDAPLVGLHADAFEVVADADAARFERPAWARPHDDLALHALARDLAHGLLREDPGLRQPVHGRLLRHAAALWARVTTAPCPWPAARPAVSRRRRRRRRR